MITYFPTPYPDESFYSVFARYGVGSGVGTIGDCNNNLYGRNRRTDFLYIGEILPEVQAVLTRNKDWETMLKEHTIYNYTSSFLLEPQKTQALQCLAQNDKLFREILPSFNRPTRKIEKIMKYCPVCVKEDREQYGEAYWHRMWIIPEIVSCPKHHCCLYETKISASHTEKTLSSAELFIPEESEIKASHPIADQISGFVSELMNCEHTLKIPIDDIIRHGFFQRGYMPATGSRCRFDDVLQDIEKFYEGTDIRIPSKYQLRSIMDNDAIFMHEIVTILVFLGISVDDVFSIEKSPNDIFLEKIEAMHKSGMTVNEISTKLEIDAQIVKYNLVVNVYHIV